MNSIPGIDIQFNGVYREEIHVPGGFLETAGKFADLDGTVILMSGGSLDCARYHILAAAPWLSVRARGNRIDLQTRQNTITLSGNPFNTLQDLLEVYHRELSTELPVEAGLFGYLAYDLKDHLETLPRTAVDDLGLPQLCLFAPSILLVREKATGQTTLCIPRRTENGQDTLANDLETAHAILNKPAAGQPEFHGDSGGFTSNFTQEAYVESIRTIRDYIAAGDVYQVNMSQRFQIGFSGSPFALFASLYETNPAPFFAYIQAGDHQIVSTSPERFIQQTGSSVETRPIKGTRPRGDTPQTDRKMREQLRVSTKDDAELSMIVDLLRNDIGKVCRGGSVVVSQHKRLEAYENVYHLVSVIQGRLAPGKTSVDLIRATFPGGSITGCPKIRSMEIIDELEPFRRHIYTGSIGYISFHDTMDLSIAIRTATIKDRRLFFSAGGGIVFDSEPEKEFQETLHKGKTVMRSLQTSSAAPPPSVRVWINGRICPLEEARISVADLGVQYGYGIFETIRVDRAEPACLSGHIDRFNRSWEQLMHDAPPDLTWNDIIRQVIDANRLADRIAAVKIMATAGTADHAHPHPTIVVSARPYTHRLAGRPDPGLHLVTYPEPRQTPLADHKTLNYLYYYLAGRYARENGGDEALILNPDHTVSETNTANVLLLQNRRITIPESPAVLPGVMEQAVCAYLKKNGWRMQRRPVHIRDLFTVDEVLLTNSLMGAVPVLSIDGAPLPHVPERWREINRQVL